MDQGPIGRPDDAAYSPTSVCRLLSTDRHRTDFVSSQGVVTGVNRSPAKCAPKESIMKPGSKDSPDLEAEGNGKASTNGAGKVVVSIQVRDPDEAKRIIEAIAACLDQLPAPVDSPHLDPR